MENEQGPGMLPPTAQGPHRRLAQKLGPTILLNDPVANAVASTMQQWGRATPPLTEQEWTDGFIDIVAMLLQDLNGLRIKHATLLQETEIKKTKIILPGEE